MRSSNQIPKHKLAPDPKFGSLKIAKFINYVMKNGKKSTAQGVVYGSFEIISEKLKSDPLEIFDKAIKNIAPVLEVKGRRVGGANYQIPIVVSNDRKQVLAFRWLIAATAKRKGKSMSAKLAEELIAASNNEGEAIKKREDTHKMAEANRAFAHFA